MELYWFRNGCYGVIPGRNIVKSAGIGVWTPENVDILIESLLRLAKNFDSKPWAYVADPSKMSPISNNETSAAFVKLHEKFEAAGCKAIAFLDGNTTAMKELSQRHQDLSNTNMQVLHFENEKQALNWLEKIGI